jgi:hypothetical protein
MDYRVAQRHGEVLGASCSSRRASGLADGVVYRWCPQWTLSARHDRQPRLMKERAPQGGCQSLDRVLPISLARSADGHADCSRIGAFWWPPQVPFAWRAAGLVVFVLGMGLMTGHDRQQLFSLVVRIQKIRAYRRQQWPYAAAPSGHVSGILFQLATPVMLGTLWALVSRIGGVAHPRPHGVGRQDASARWMATKIMPFGTLSLRVW